MRMTKKITSIVLAVLMVVSMMVVGTVAASALDATNADFEFTNLAGTSVQYKNASGSMISGSGTYKLLRNTTVSSRMATGIFASNVTIDLNGYTLTSTAEDYAFLVSRSGSASSPNKFTIMSSKSGGKVLATGLSDDDTTDCVIGTSYTSTAKYTEITIASSATIESEACIVAIFGDHNTVNVAGGTLKTTGNDFAIATNGAETTNATINIYNGSVTSTGAAAIYQPSDGTLNIIGGTITGTTGVYVKSGTTNITGGTIKGTGDASNYNYNGSGADSTGDAFVVDSCGYPGGAPEVNIIGGSFTSTNAQPVASYVGQDDADYTGVDQTQVVDFIEGGTFKSTNGTVDTAAMDAYVNDTTSFDASTGKVTVPADYVAVVEDQYFTDYAAAVDYANGTKLVYMLKKGTPDYQMSVGQEIIVNSYTKAPVKAPAGAYAAKWYYDSASKIYTWKAVEAVASITSGGNTTYYATLYDALSGAATGSTINILKDSTETGGRIGSLTSSKTITIDLGGHTIDVEGSATAAYSIYNGSKVTVTNGTMNFNLTGENPMGFVVGYSATGTTASLTLEDDVTITATGNAAAVYVQGGTLTTEADITTENYAAITTNGSQTVAGSAININGGNITTTNDVALFLPGKATTTITDGNITGETAVYAKSGTLDIQGGTFTATGAKSDYTYSGSGCYSTGDAIVVDNCGYPGGAPVVTVSGGTFTSTNAKGIGSYAGNTETDLASVNATSNEIAIPDDEKWVANSTSGGYDLVKKEYVAQVGSTKYESLAEAVAAAEDGDTVKLLKSVTEAVSITGKTLTLDLNGYNITSPSTTQPIKVYGGTKLTIDNSNVAKSANTPTQNAILGSNGGTNNYGSLFASGEGTEVIIKAGYYYGYNGDKTAIHAVNKAKVTFYDCVVNGAAGFDGEGTSGKEGKIFYSGVGNPTQPYAMDPGYIVVHGGTFSGRMSDSNWGNYEIDGGTFDRNVVVINENPRDAQGNRVATASGNMTKIKDGTLEESNWLVEGFAPKANANGTFSVEVDTNPLNPFITSAADAKTQDENKFGLTCNYLKGTLLGVQKKEAMVDDIEGSDKTSESNQEGEKNIRFVAVLDTTLLQGADDYGFVLAKLNDTKNYSNTAIENLKAGDDRAKTISAKGTYNNVCGKTAYGDPTDGSTDYKYVTCAVNNINADDQVLARFYYKKDGKTFYAKYAGQNYGYTGCISPADPA